jgi:hypothetical protein
VVLVQEKAVDQQWDEALVVEQQIFVGIADGSANHRQSSDRDLSQRSTRDDNQITPAKLKALVLLSHCLLNYTGPALLGLLAGDVQTKYGPAVGLLHRETPLG